MPEVTETQIRSAPHVRHFAAAAAAIYLLATLAMFGDLLFGTRAVVSAPGSDVTTFNLPLREYAFGALREGRLPLWNPHVYAGMPLAANMQAALFYPPNWLHLVMPDVTAINAGVALHFFLAAWFTALWAHARTRCTPASLLAGILFACSGGYFLHVHPGHITLLHAAAWSPAVFLGIDQLMGWGGMEAVTGRKRLRWAAALAMAAGMAILAGHPQTAYYIAVGAGVYALAHPDQWRGRIAGFVALLAAGAGAAGLAAVQLLPAWKLAHDSTRSTGLTAEAMRQFALPAENLLTVALPHLFGGPGQAYAGRWLLPDGSIFIGAVAVMLAAYAGAMVPRTRRLLIAAAVLIFLAGVEPMVQGLARVALPGYATFRAAGRFAVLVDLLLAIAAAEGLAAMIARGRPPKGAVVGSLLAAAALLASGAWLASSPAEWTQVLREFEQSGMSLVAPRQYRDLAFIKASHTAAWGQSITTGAILAVAGGLLAAWRARATATWAWALLFLAAAEVGWVARSERASAPPDPGYPQAWAPVVRQATGAGERVATVPLEWANMGMRLGYDDALGYDPTSLARYAKFIAVSQGADWTALDFVPPVRRPSPLLEALRVRAVLYTQGPEAIVATIDQPLPRFLLVHQYELCEGVDEVWPRLARGPDLRRVALLEQRPDPEPAPGEGATVRIVRQTPEQVEIEAATAAPAILVMTDTYAPGWEAVDAAGSRQFKLMPANGALRAIALPAGRHRLLIRYRAPGLAAGALMTGVTALAAGTALLVSRRRSRRAISPAGGVE